jgi:drug/metabolite transporter (DMT)-like permease
MSTESLPPPAAGGDNPPASGGPRPFEAAFAGLSSALLFGLFLVLPVAGSVALAFAAVPLVRHAHRRGLAGALAGCLLAAGVLAGLGLAMGGLTSAISSAAVAFASTALPVLAAAAVRRGMRPSKAWLLLAAAGFAVLAGVLGPIESGGGAPLREEIGRAFDSISPGAGKSAPSGDLEATARASAMLAKFKEFAQTYWLGLVGASWTLASAVSFYLGARAARPAPSGEATRFEQLRVPAAVVALFAAAGAAFALLHGAGRVVAGNLLLPLLALYFLAGLSIICHFARKWFRARILRVGLYALVAYFPLNVAVGLLGIFDWYADFRRRGEKT